MEKFYIVSNYSKLGIDYIERLEYIKKISKIFDDFSRKNEIETTEFYPIVERLWISPTENDCKKYSSQFVLGETGKFKKNSVLSKEWTEFCKTNGLRKTIHKPFVGFYFNNVFGDIRTRLFDVDNVIYCSVSCQTNFTPTDGITEIKGSEFYKIIEKYENKE